MDQTTKIYQYINYFLLALSFLYWTADTGSVQFLFFIGMTGTIGLIILNNFNPDTGFWIISAYLLFMLTIVSLSSFGLAFFLLVLIFALRAPSTFLNGMVYTFWLFLIIFTIIDYIPVDLPFSYLYAFNIDLAHYIISSYLWAILLGGYIISVLPHYIEGMSTDSERFHTASLFIVWPLTLILQIVVGILLGLFFHLKNFISLFKPTVRNHTAEEAEGNIEPAFEQYWLQKSYRDWKAHFKATKARNKQTRVNINNRMQSFKDSYEFPLSAIPNSALAFTKFTIGVLEYSLLIVTSLIHFAIISIIFIPVFLYYTFFHLYDTYYLRKNKVATICPSCYHHSQLPNYLCEACDREHVDLRPGVFGIRKRKCLCGTKLPTTAIDKRYDLQAICENEACKVDLLTKEATPITLSIIGGPSSGKTSFLMTTMHDIKEKLIRKEAWSMEFLQADEENAFNNQTLALAQGQYPNKTIEHKPFAYNLKLTSQQWKRPKLLYMYDPAGEAYSHSDNLRSHHYLDYIDGYVLIIDPFAIPEVSVQYEEDNVQFAQEVNPSTTLPEDTYNRLMIHIANEYNVKETEKISVPIAIVINKVDAYDIEHDIIGDQKWAGNGSQGQELGQEPEQDQGQGQGPDQGQNQAHDDKTHEQCKAFLNNNGYRTFVNQIESKFKTYRFFTSTSANLADTTKERGSNVVKWMIDQK